MNFFPTSRKVLPTFGTYCPVRVQIAQTIVPFTHFQLQALTAAHNKVKFLYTATFH